MTTETARTPDEIVLLARDPRAALGLLVPYRTADYAPGRVPAEWWEIADREDE